VLCPSAYSGELVQELTTKLGAQKVVTVRSVEPGNTLEADFAGGRRLAFPKRLLKNDKKYLALTPLPVARNVPPYHPPMLIAIPWQNIKEITAEKATSTVLCSDGAKFAGTILTEVTDTDGLKYHVGSLKRMTVKAVTKSEGQEDAAPVAKCSVQFDNLAQSFKARRAGFRHGYAVMTDEKFEMKVDGEVVAGNLSDFEKVIVKGSTLGPNRITLRATNGKETNGELMSKDGSGRSLIFGSSELSVWHP